MESFKQEIQKERLLFFDLIRAFAAIMMIQGHTIDSLLSDNYRNGSIFYFWEFLRGFTAPIFIFISGTIFTYLLLGKQTTFWQNKRVKKGIKRALTLLFVGYLLRYPTSYIFYFGDVTESQWQIFFTVDILHLIAFSLLFILFFYYLHKTLNFDLRYLFLGGAIVVLLAFPFARDFEWTAIFPVFIANYFYKNNGSLFPLTPFLFFAFMGALFGVYLNQNKTEIKKTSFSVKLLIASIAFFVISYIAYLIEIKIYAYKLDFNSYEVHLMIFRLGLTFFATSVFHYISTKLNSLPKIVLDFGKYSFFVYVAHLVILYGSAWSIGINYFLYKKLGPIESVLIAAAMIYLMLTFVKYLAIYTEYKKQIKLSVKQQTIYEKV